jgi:hypothetical protein
MLAIAMTWASVVVVVNVFSSKSAGTKLGENSSCVVPFKNFSQQVNLSL